MPTYEYKCEECHEEFEYFQSMSEAPKDVCEKCGGKLARLLSAGAGLIFKGSGFYITDYKKSNSSPGGSSESKGSGSSSTSAAATAETKPSSTAAEPKSDK